MLLLRKKNYSSSRQRPRKRTLETVGISLCFALWALTCITDQINQLFVRQYAMKTRHGVTLCAWLDVNTHHGLINKLLDSMRWRHSTVLGTSQTPQNHFCALGMRSKLASHDRQLPTHSLTACFLLGCHIIHHILISTDEEELFVLTIKTQKKNPWNSRDSMASHVLIRLELYAGAWIEQCMRSIKTAPTKGEAITMPSVTKTWQVLS